MKKNIEELVYKALVDKPETRKDDYKLIHAVLNNFVDDKMSLEAVMLHHTELGLPSLETITRCRRRLQEKDLTLVDPNAKKFRQKETKEILDYIQERGC